jgi:hypothetical protein
MSTYRDNNDLSPEGLQQFDQRQRFEKGLQTGRPRREQLWNGLNLEKINVRSLGHISPQQFKEQFQPTGFAESWDELASDEATPHLEQNVGYKMNELEQSIKENGMVRPVIVGPERQIPPNQYASTERGRTGYTRPGEVIDGHHRVIAAIRAGVHIPVNVVDKSHFPYDGSAGYIWNK